jgi:hypothetical protein
MYCINYIFIVLEIVLGFVVMCRFMNTQSAAFYLRTAPLIDKIFQFKYFRGTTSAADANYEIRSSRQIELGTLRYDRIHDAAMDVFSESDAVRPTVVNNNEEDNNNNMSEMEGMSPFGGDGAKMHDE